MGINFPKTFNMGNLNVALYNYTWINCSDHLVLLNLIDLGLASTCVCYDIRSYEIQRNNNKNAVSVFY